MAHMTRQRQRRTRSPFFKWLLLLVLVGGIFVYLWHLVGTSTSQTQRATTTIQTETPTTSTQETTETTQETTWQKQTEPVHIPILMYHAIHQMAPEEVANANLIVAPDVFESHIKSLKEAGYYFLSPEEAYKALTENSLPAEKVVWLTFDDSLWDFYDYAYPTLKKYGAKATNNVITGTVGNSGNLSLDEMKEMQQHGISLQSHTVNHPDLEYATLDTQTAELTESKAYLDTALTQETMTIAYPAGRYSNDTLTIANSLHYQLGLTTNEGLASADNGLLSLNRVRILPTTTAEELLTRINP